MRRIVLVTLLVLMSGCEASIGIESFKLKAELSFEEYAQKPLLEHFINLTKPDDPAPGEAQDEDQSVEAEN